VILFVAAVGALLVAAGIAEYRIHISRLEKIPIRILVNGTRGKSTVTRLIAAGLAEGGLRVCAKTTGSAARLILPDLSEEPIRRRRGTTIMEHKWFVRRSVGLKAQAIVAECMAIQPETIWTLEHRLARSTIGVITNVRADHLDTMGTELSQIAEALALSVPEQGQVFVGAEGLDEELKAIFKRAGQGRSSKSRASRRERVSAPTSATKFVGADDAVRSWCARFAYPMFAENLALALAVCQECGVQREVALRGMLKIQPDPGVRASVEFEWRGVKVRAVNAFAANDAQSTLMLWRRELASLDRLKGPFQEAVPGQEAVVVRKDSAGPKATAGQKDAICQPAASVDSNARAEDRRARILVFNHRDDRPWRAFQLAEIAERFSADAVVVFGMSRWLARRLVKDTLSEAARSGEPRSASGLRSVPVRVLRASESRAESVLEAALEMLPHRPCGIDVLCAGNIKGPGMTLTASLDTLLASSEGRT
jgi:poly-gamma-glutamate synthase PgsB/CapB